MLFLSFSKQINLCHVFKMFAFGTHGVLSHGCGNYTLFNAVPNVYLHN